MPQNTIPQDPNQLDPKIVKVMSAIKKIESGGDYNAVGDNGESHGAYQWNKNNFHNQATQFGFDPNDFSPANQNKVAYARIKSLKDAGRQPEEIAAIWNGARKEGDRYTYVNPEYGNKFRTALGQLSTKTAIQPVSQETQPSTPTVEPDQTEQNPVKKIAGGVGNFLRGAADLVLSPAESLGTHLGQGAAGLTADALEALHIAPGEVEKIRSRQSQPMKTLTGGTVQPLKKGLAGAAQIGGDALQTGLLAAAPGIGKGASLLGRVGSNAALGAGFGAGSKLSEGNTDIKDIAATATGGALLGGALGVGGELVGKAAQYLPQRITRSFIPGINSETASYAVQKGLGSPVKMLSESNSSLAQLGSKLDSALKAEGESYVQPSGEELFSRIAEKFPDSGLTSDAIKEEIKSLIPLKKNLVDKIFNGDASLKELHTMNSDLGSAVYKQVFDNPQVKAGKQIGNAAYHAISDFLKQAAPKSAPIFEEFSKEIQLNSALKKAVRSKEKARMFTLRDLVAILAGAHLGPGGALAGYLGEKALTNPTVNLKTASILSKLGGEKAAMVGSYLKAPVLQNLTGSSPQR